MKIAPIDNQGSYRCLSSNFTFTVVSLVAAGIFFTGCIALAGNQILGSRASHFYQVIGKKEVSVSLISISVIFFGIYLLTRSEENRNSSSENSFSSSDMPQKFSNIEHVLRQPEQEIQTELSPQENLINPESDLESDPESEEEPFFSCDEYEQPLPPRQDIRIEEIQLKKEAIIDSLDNWLEKPQQFFNLYLIKVYKPVSAPELSEQKLNKKEESISKILEKMKEVFKKELDGAETLEELENIQNDIQQVIGFPLFLFTRVVSFIKNHTLRQTTVSFLIGTIQTFEWIAKPLTVKDMKNNKFRIYSPRFQQTVIPNVLTDFIYESIDVLATLPMYRENPYNQKLINLFEGVYIEAAKEVRISMIPKSLRLGFSKIEWEVPDSKGDQQLIENYNYFNLYDKIQREIFSIS